MSEEYEWRHGQALKAVGCVDPYGAPYGGCTCEGTGSCDCEAVADLRARIEELESAIRQHRTDSREGGLDEAALWNLVAEAETEVR